MGDIDMSAIRDAEYLGPWSSTRGGNWYQFLMWWYGRDKYLEMLESNTLPPEPNR